MGWRIGTVRQIAYRGKIEGRHLHSVNQKKRNAGMAELVDALASGASDGNVMGVRVSLPALGTIKTQELFLHLYARHSIRPPQ